MYKTHFNNRLLKQSLKLTFSYIILSFTFVFILLFLMQSSIINHFKLIQKVNFPLMESTQSAAHNQLSAQNVMYKLCLTTDPSSQEKYVLEQDNYDMNLQKDLKYILKNAPEYKNSIVIIQNLLQESLTFKNQAILYCKQNQPTMALQLLEKEYFSRMTSVQGELLTLYNIFLNHNNAFLKHYSTQSIIIMCLVLLSFILMIFISFHLIKKLIVQIQSPLTEIGFAMSEMAKGQLEFHLPYKATNELGILADEMRYMGRELLTYVSNITDVLTCLSKKQYNTDVTIKYQGMFLPIQEALNTIIIELNEVMTSFKQTAQDINECSSNMLTTSTTLSESAVTQSASVQEMAATMENIASQVQQNANNSKIASKHMIVLEKKLNEGNTYTHHLLELMQETACTAQEIEKIIDIIEKISRQTRLLALNSTIEAAKTEQNGNAFSILAQQMSNLAIESSKAVTLTKQLISNTLHSIEKSHESVSKTASIISELTMSSQTISSHIQSVTSATTTQAEAICNFYFSIEEMTQVIDANTKVALELANKGYHLEENARHLNQKLNAFTLKSS